jgi:ABC-type transport system involved in cytochrome c biogenesis ATPase subunit
VLFTVLAVRSRPSASDTKQAFLVDDNWDDHSFKTLFHLWYVDENGARTKLGGVKIAGFGLKPPVRVELPETFEVLPEGYFSLGQDDGYYEQLTGLGSEVRDEILMSLRDLAFDDDLFARAIHEEVTGVSLLREVRATTVRGQFHRLAHGGVRLSEYSFSYALPARSPGTLPPVDLTFDVRPESQPPTNIHVLIGRNGVGKTRLLHLMSRALVEDHTSPEEVGCFSGAQDSAGSTFANLVSVTFSAFDPFDRLPEHRNKAQGLQYSYVGLKPVATADGKPQPPKSFSQLSAEFVKSVRLCRNGARAARWRRALEMLEADPIFKDANVAALADGEPDALDAADGEDHFAKAASTLFGRLSSGHKIVLLTITRLVETVDERSLVLFDEPETHLHPPLLSAFVRSLSDLLIDRNGVAIIATHSPVILQEVPRSCVWKVRRSGAITHADRPEIETFGESVGILTREVFGLEVTQSGFHRMLEKAVEEEGQYYSVYERFDGQLGAEAMALLRALVSETRADGHGE